jgi:predicted acyl esterase
MTVLSWSGSRSVADQLPSSPDAARVNIQWSVKVPLRDGIRLDATLYAPKDQNAPAPCVVTLTPYDAQGLHGRGVYFAAHGMPFLAVDVRGRGNSEGQFHPFIQEDKDGYDVVEWLARHADTLEAVTAESTAYFLDSRSDCTDIFTAGSLSREPSDMPRRDQYFYDPRELSNAEYDSGGNLSYLTDQRSVLAGQGHELVYHTARFAQYTEISGFFELSAWLSIDQSDADFRASVYEIGADGRSILLTTDQMRARYRESLFAQRPITTGEPMLYEFKGFTFVSRQVRKGGRLRLVIGPINSISTERNYSTGGTVADESIKEARPITVTLYHDRSHRSVLYVPIGQP